MFLDQVDITVSGGHGGRGCVSWRREKFVPKGGPDGGNGGRGGDAYLVVDDNTDTLSNFASQKKFAAERGMFGMGRSRNGKSGEDLLLPVPPGTVVTNRTNGERIGDLTTKGQLLLVAKGGRGGYGNEHFKSAVRQRPDFAELGEPGDTVELHLELHLVADVGIIGFPNVGKSTLISVVSSARPEVADYEFTTLSPNLGVVMPFPDERFVICDVPGLIEGASDGKGLGHRFLQHIERCSILLHVLDATRALNGTEVDPDALIRDYRVIRSELLKHSQALAAKQEVVVINKIDAVLDDPERLIQALRKEGINVDRAISAKAHQGAEELMKAMYPQIKELRQQRKESEQVTPEETVVLNPLHDDQNMRAYQVELENETVRVTGSRLEQLTTMTDFISEGGIKRWRNVLDRIGLEKLLKKEKEAGKTILIGDIEVTEFL